MDETRTAAQEHLLDLFATCEANTLDGRRVVEDLRRERHRWIAAYPTRETAGDDPIGWALQELCNGGWALYDTLYLVVPEPHIGAIRRMARHDWRADECDPAQYWVRDHTPDGSGRIYPGGRPVYRSPIASPEPGAVVLRLWWD